MSELMQNEQNVIYLLRVVFADVAVSIFTNS